MRTHTPHNVLGTALAVLALGFFHSATPVAVSAQARASLTASATILPADAAWTGHELTEAVRTAALADSGATTGASFANLAGTTAATFSPDDGVVRMERDGTVVWVRPTTPDDDRTLVMVAHLGS